MFEDSYNLMSGSITRGPASMSPNEISGKTNGNGIHADSPLKIFVLAKRKINDIFSGINDYVGESKSFLVQLNSDVILQDEVQEVIGYGDKVSGIRDVLTRDHMKVAFFGRTSNGKSTVINAVLQTKILPAGLGHTTNCFLQVEGSDSNESYMTLDSDPDKRLSVDLLLHQANAVRSENLGDSSLVRIFWPKQKCGLLRDDVVLVDSPGIDVTGNLDEWIDKHCQDADVFVLVSNAESTLMRTETAFFHKVSEKLSKPNIFILNNRCDASVSEPEYQDLVRKQHMDRDVAFLCDELNVVSRAEAEHRVFFVSAKEVLQARLAQQNDLPGNTGMAEGFQHRYFEFENFERKFEECLSKTAVKTKFDQHSKRGKKITQDLKLILDSVHIRASDMKQDKLETRKEQYDKLELMQQQMNLLTNEVKHQICHLVDQVEQKVSSALNEEIRRLSLLVNDFEKPFSSDNLVVSVYKKELHNHVEKGLGSNMRARLSTALQCSVEGAQKEMIERVSALLPPQEQQRQFTYSITPRQNFEVLYRLNCESLCSEFQEDLEFRFSFGLLQMYRRFRSGKSDTIPKSLPPTAPQTPSNEMKIVSTHTTDVLSLIDKMSLVSPQSQTTVGILAVSGFMVLTIGWRVIAITCGIYGLLYMYERLTWTNKAKERSFKKQYVQHATRKLKLIVDLTSANCSHQVQQELSSTFARLCHLVDEIVNDMQADMKTLDDEIDKLDESANNARILRNKANYLATELDNFSEKYLTFDS